MSERNWRGKKPFTGQVHCPFPGCTHIGGMITKVHSRTHGIEREELFEKYGKPEPVQICHKAYRENRAIKTIIPDNKPVISGQRAGSSRV